MNLRAHNPATRSWRRCSPKPRTRQPKDNGQASNGFKNKTLLVDSTRSLVNQRRVQGCACIQKSQPYGFRNSRSMFARERISATALRSRRGTSGSGFSARAWAVMETIAVAEFRNRLSILSKVLLVLWCTLTLCLAKIQNGREIGSCSTVDNFVTAKAPSFNKIQQT
jgi:hypothetical protein